MYIRSIIYYVCALWKINKYSFFLSFFKFVTCFFRICVMSGEEAICTGAKKNLKMMK
jgi:hypothetical protein